ncbi:hypothetical protein [Thalassolituus sp.]|uniref:hypothetical protein n=1 Tax=Thalassolituus sp. TaxID=2030822 RepID=UPI003517B097
MQAKHYYSSEVEAKREALRLYNTKYLNSKGGLDSIDEITEGLVFFLWLEQNHPNVLSFQYSGSKEQLVKTWIGCA